MKVSRIIDFIIYIKNRVLVFINGLFVNEYSIIKEVDDNDEEGIPLYNSYYLDKNRGSVIYSSSDSDSDSGSTINMENSSSVLRNRDFIVDE